MSKQKKNKASLPKILGIYTDKGRINSNGLIGAVGWYRIMNPLEKLGANIRNGFTFTPTYENALEMKALGDIWVSKMADNENIDFTYAAHRDVTKSKLIIDLDDDPILINEDHPEKDKIQERQHMRERMIKIADHVICSTDEIAESIKHLNSHTTVIPNAIDPKIWDVTQSEKKDDKIRIGWIASGSHVSEFPLIFDAFKAVRNKYPNVEIHIAGIITNDFEDDRIFHHTGTSGYMDFPQWYADLNIDIAVAPLIDTPFNRAKSNIKWLEASMLEIPCVCSEVVYGKSVEHGKTGYIAKNSSQFTKYLSWFIENPDKRREIGKNAKEEVLKNWTIDKILPKYIELFNKMNDKKDITVITSITGGKDKLIEQPEYLGVKYLAFTDQQSSGWETKKPCDKFVSPVMNAKIHKVLAHKYCDTPYIVWMDGNMELKTDPRELVELMGDNDFAFFKHPGRDCIYEEAEACMLLGKGNEREIGEQIKAYADPTKGNVAPHSGLYELTAFVRKNTPEANKLFEAWWADICRYSNRDQLSFPFIFKDSNMEIIPGTIGFLKDNEQFPGNKYFKQYKHEK